MLKNTKEFNFKTNKILKVEKFEGTDHKDTMPAINVDKNKINPYEADCDNVKRINQELV